MNRNVLLFSALLAVTTASARSTVSPEVRALQKSVAASNGLGLEVLKKQFETQGAQKNLNFSPVSLNQALSLIALGADGRTEETLKDKLGLDVVSSLRAEDTLKTRLALLKSADGEDGYVFEIANALFANGEGALRADYTAKGERVLQAQAQSLDFLQERSVSVINQWAADKTRGKITQVINSDTLRSLEALVANATYFKAKWTVPFETHKTMTIGFTKGDGSRANVPAMQRKMSSPIVSRAGELKATRIDYKGGAASFYVIVPENLPQYLSKLDNVGLRDLIHEIDAADASHALVRMPSFKFKNTMNLNQALSDLGLGVIFDAGADFSKMSDRRLKVSYVKQDTFIAVDNEGTEAAAVTTIGMGRTSVEPRPFVFSVDSAFLYVIRDTRSDDILFVGTVIDPTLE